MVSSILCRVDVGIFRSNSLTWTVYYPPPPPVEKKYLSSAPKKKYLSSAPTLQMFSKNQSMRFNQDVGQQK